ncbi:uncharacterized protein ATNIH1004_007090 [Aspergillus tanneri]|uniref:Vacuolar ATPase assembly protein VMA22 n=1 Tax=Aspergillus tanneri TaxID=1220188 RepID=A0A5M9MFF1_9EURO|nr:uncharacterized protein ATNIH1004_007090 [Aspergillus tanneri]KAA8645671.1 hypothetical protein ATNIH1004_007090 [Aspergillus tanneri]
MARISTPPASRHGSEATDAEIKKGSIADSSSDLLQSLDTLLEKYLFLLDQHQKFQTELASRLSSALGFFFSCASQLYLSAGRHYGADYYDERMKATRKVVLQPLPDLNEDNHAIELSDPNQKSDSDALFTIKSGINDHVEPSEADEENEASQANNGPREPHSQQEDKDSVDQVTVSFDSLETSDTEPKAASESNSSKKPRSSDPIRWYGILVPPFLRSAQKSFTEAVDEALPQLASIIFKMRVIESEIGRLRSELGKHEDTT